MSTHSLTEVQADDGVSWGGRQLSEVLRLLLELGEEAIAGLGRHRAHLAEEAAHVVGLEQRLCLVHGEHHGLLLNVTAEEGAERGQAVSMFEYA